MQGKTFIICFDTKKVRKPCDFRTFRFPEGKNYLPNNYFHRNSVLVVLQADDIDAAGEAVADAH